MRVVERQLQVLERRTAVKRILYLVGFFVLLLSLPAWAERPCELVGGVLITNVGAIEGKTNLGPVFGDLAGSVAATIVDVRNGNYIVQHYWVTSSGDTIKFGQAILKPSTVISTKTGANVVAVEWGNYVSPIEGGTGKYKKATGYLEYFGLADFVENTLVLRYRGRICY